MNVETASAAWEDRQRVLEGQDRVRELEARLAKLEAAAAERQKENSISILCFSDDWDRLFASFMLANGALAMGQEVHMFFTFWALAALRKETRSEGNRTLMDKMLAGMLPSGAGKTRLSKMHFGGLGKWMMQKRMRDRGVAQLDELVAAAAEMGAHIHVCELSADLLGLGPEQLQGAGPVELCGVATFLGQATKGQAVLFV
jgi:peroxiredoxin family protein